MTASLDGTAPKLRGRPPAGRRDEKVGLPPAAGPKAKVGLPPTGNPPPDRPAGELPDGGMAGLRLRPWAAR